MTILMSKRLYSKLTNLTNLLTNTKTPTLVFPPGLWIFLTFCTTTHPPRFRTILDPWTLEVKPHRISKLSVCQMLGLHLGTLPVLTLQTRCQLPRIRCLQVAPKRRQCAGD